MSTTNRSAAAKKAAARARVAESKGERTHITVEFRDDSFTFSRDDVNDLEFLEAVEDDKYIVATRRVLGAEQWGRLKDVLRNDDGRIPPEAFNEFCDALIDAADLGNSSASRDS